MASKSSVTYVNVAPCVPLGPRGRNEYTYAIPKPSNIALGSVVTIPFGKRAITGVVTVLDVQRPSYPTKEIARIFPIRITDTQFQFAQWLSESAHGPLGYTLRLFLPPSLSGIVVSPPAVPRVARKRSGARGAGIKRTQIIIEKNAEKRRRAIKKHIKKQKGQVLILVPEKAMLAEYATFFEKELQDKSAVLYSAQLTSSQKKEIWIGVNSGSIRIIIGTQKALFLPFLNLSCICIDEEQVESYKMWDQYPRLHTVLGAEKLANISCGSLVYASSYPSIHVRHAIQAGEYVPKPNNPIRVDSTIYAFSFDDKKWKRPIPNELASKIRMWARNGQHILLVFNKKDTAELKKSLLWKLSKKARENIVIKTIGVLSEGTAVQYDRAVWMTPEWVFRTIDYRYSERARVMLARIAGLTTSGEVALSTRYADIARDIFEEDEQVWEEKILKERKRFLLPPYANLVRLSVRDKTDKKAKSRAYDVRAMLETSIADKKDITVFGPYQELGKSIKKLVEYHILLAGKLEDLIPLHKKLPVDSADVDPKRVV